MKRKARNGEVEDEDDMDMDGDDCKTKKSDGSDAVDDSDAKTPGKKVKFS